MTDLENLVAIERIRRLQARYVRVADEKDWDALSTIFMPDASFTSHDVDGRTLSSMTGREEIRSRIAAAVGEAIVVHQLFSYEIDIAAPDRAQAVWAMADWLEWPASGTSLADASGRTMRGHGHYHVTYQLHEGEWYIAELKLQRTRLDFT